MLYHVVAMAKNRVIGKENKLPWHFSSDLKHFRQLTTGQTVIMGRKTFESIGKPLPNRENFVVSRSRGVGAEGLRFFNSPEKAFEAVRTDSAYIIGGADLFRQTMEGINGIYLTLIEQAFEGDAFYPQIPEYFEKRSSHLLQENPMIRLIFYENTKNNFLRTEEIRRVERK
ncbi:MAG: dihydrofolate reductase [Candidatus Omnitrophica bacterium]|nr:dihydrofolate reductase [Candidatus Omnitrophota bacterium]